MLDQVRLYVKRSAAPHPAFTLKRPRFRYQASVHDAEDIGLALIEGPFCPTLAMAIGALKTEIESKVEALKMGRAEAFNDDWILKPMVVAMYDASQEQLDVVPLMQHLKRKGHRRDWLEQLRMAGYMERSSLLRVRFRGDRDRSTEESSKKTEAIQPSHEGRDSMMERSGPPDLADNASKEALYTTPTAAMHNKGNSPPTMLVTTFDAKEAPEILAAQAPNNSYSALVRERAFGGMYGNTKPLVDAAEPTFVLDRFIKNKRLRVIVMGELYNEFDSLPDDDLRLTAVIVYQQHVPRRHADFPMVLAAAYLSYRPESLLQIYIVEESAEPIILCITRSPAKGFLPTHPVFRYRATANNADSPGQHKEVIRGPYAPTLRGALHALLADIRLKVDLKRSRSYVMPHERDPTIPAIGGSEQVDARALVQYLKENGLSKEWERLRFDSGFMKRRAVVKIEVVPSGWRPGC
ncbi:hypothetical protein LTR66_006638 [Elasticomyces elasticus]|nr:hypothetical protein LTR66_006638 [Elasticomyces elasticus]